jgi:DNA-directed RNA polymerase specialized sigma subunit
MADKPNKRVPSPGISGAIKDAVGAISDAVAPRSITQRGKKVADAIDEADPAPKSDLGSQF